MCCCCGLLWQLSVMVTTVSIHLRGGAAGSKAAYPLMSPIRSENHSGGSGTVISPGYGFEFRLKYKSREEKDSEGLTSDSAH